MQLEGRLEEAIATDWGRYWQLLVAGIAVAASYVPARRAVHIAPTEALRAD